MNVTTNICMMNGAHFCWNLKKNPPMTKSPDRIWAHGSNWYDDGKCSDFKNDGFCLGLTRTEYIRADLHSELMRAAYELADVVVLPVRSDDGYYDYDQDRVDTALTAYQQAKEKCDAL